jgi:hypothetical protein
VLVGAPHDWSASAMLGKCEIVSALRPGRGSLRERLGTIAILDGCVAELQYQGPAVGVDHGVPLSDQHVLTRTVAVRTARINRPHALAHRTLPRPRFVTGSVKRRRSRRSFTG